MPEETAADVLAEVKDVEVKLEGLAASEASVVSEAAPAAPIELPFPAPAGASAPETAPDSGALADASKPAAVPAEASPAAPEFKDSVGNVFSADGILIRREGGFEGTNRQGQIN